MNSSSLILRTTFTSASLSIHSGARALSTSYIAALPPAARDQVNEQLAKNGVPFDIGQLKPENLEELISHLNDLTVDVDSADAKVRVYCE